ncbi:sulfatase family protein [Tundrisphaera sp. TA3]|uniref:sulfatase family protein n=1 Tax=Tundrisphaera sp. TA3 TaxID=3435775 RepID=UPI003EBCBC51
MRSMVLLLVAIGLAVPSGRASGDDGSGRPDVVLFLADDLGWGDIPIHGGKDVATPNMARLAADGMTFSRAFVASPSCAPSRAALLTGLDPMRNGAMLNHARPNASVRTWPSYFQALGYEVAAIGKTAHYAQVTTYGFDHASHYTYHDDTCVEQAVSWLAKRAAGPKPLRPICLIIGTNWSHVPWPGEGALNPRDVDLPPTLVDTPATRRARARYAQAVANADRDLGMAYDAARASLGPETLFLFSSDHGSQFPFGKWNCYDAGVRTPLIVAWPGRIKPGSRTDAMVNWTDILPTCLEAVGGVAPAGLSGRSFLGVLRGEKDTHRDKVFLTHSGDGKMNEYPIRAVRTADWKYIRNLNPTAEHHTHVDKAAGGDGRNYFDSWVAKAKTDPGAAAVLERYHRRPAEELYDLRTDPWELRNLAADRDHAETLAALRQELDTWMKDQGDEGMTTERALPDPRAKAEASR